MKALALLSLLLLAGCASQPGLNLASEQAVSTGQELNDEALTVAEFTICYGASVGSIRRRYGSDERAEIWQALCNSTDDFAPGSGK